MLNESINEMVERGFQVSNLSYYKAYEISIKMDDKIVRLTKGNQTRGYYISTENFSRSSEDYAISLKLFV
jgi:phage anti-repressor protein